MEDSNLFSKMLIFCFCFLGIFAIILSSMDSRFLAVQSIDATYQTDKVAQAVLSNDNLTVYDNQASFNHTYPSSIEKDLGLGGDEKIEFWWGFEYGRKLYEVRHTRPGPFGWWKEYDRLYIVEPYRTQAGFSAPNPIGLEKVHIENLWGNKGGNGSYCEWQKGPYKVNTYFFPRDNSLSIGQAWDANNLTLYVSYEIDWNATNLNAFSLLGQILFFKTPSLGLTGVANTIFNGMVALPLWVMIAIIIIKLIQSMIPFIKGTDE